MFTAFTFVELADNQVDRCVDSLVCHRGGSPGRAAGLGAPAGSALHDHALRPELPYVRQKLFKDTVIDQV